MSTPGDRPRSRDFEPTGSGPGEAVRGRGGPLGLVWRAVAKGWNDDVLGKSGETAFWQTLALPPLLIALLGSVGYVVDWFGNASIQAVKQEILQFSRTVFTDSVVNQIIAPTIEDILRQGGAAIVSFGFVLSLWAGSSGIATLVDAITQAHNQYTVRNYLWQRVLSVLLYLVALIGAVLVLPLLAIGPRLLPQLFPEAVRPFVAELVSVAYYPTLGVAIVVGLCALYKVALPHHLPWHRALPGALLAMVVFLVASRLLRVYIRWVTGTSYTYGALAATIAFLLFAFFIALAVLVGAQFNNAISEWWPVRDRRLERRRWYRAARTRRNGHGSSDEQHAA